MNAPASIAQPLSALQRLAFFALSVVAVLIASTPGRPSSMALALALAAVAIAVWHGAFDGVLARPLLRPRFGRRWMPLFASSYVLLAATVAAVWWLFPFLGLTLFLVYSAWHFGTESNDWRRTPLSAAGAFCRGFLPISASCHWHGAEVTPIFSLMLRNSGPSAARCTHWAGAALIPLCAVVLVSTCLQPRGRNALLLLTVLELLLFWRANPLIAFAVFFCCWHTPEHLAESCTTPSGRLSLRTLRLQLQSGLLPWAISLAGLGLLLATAAHGIVAAASWLFLVLSALTGSAYVLNELRSRTRREPRAFGRGVAHAS